MNYDSHSKIIDTATELINRFGYQAVSVNQILRESGASKGSFYYHFPNGKEDVVVEILQKGYHRSVEGSKAILDRYDDVSEAFMHLIDSMTQDVEAEQHEKIVFSNLSVIALEAAGHSPRITEECNKIYVALRQLFREKVHRSGLYTEEESRYLGMILQTAIGGAIVASSANRNSGPLITLKEGLSWIFARTKQALPAEARPTE